MLVTCRKLLAELKRFAQQRAGNVALTFALATFPVIGGVGAAIDFSHANSVKSAMQVALDSTALMLAKNAASMSSDQLQTSATNYFKALFTRPEATNVTVTATYVASAGSSVVISSSANVPTAIMGIVGYHNIAVTASSTAKWGSNRLRVALVLDNTGSMAESGKIAALITATNNLLTQLKDAASVNGDVYVSIVPFVKDVNIDSSNWNSNYIYWGTAAQDTGLTDNNSWDANNGKCSVGSSSKRSQCVAQSTCSISGYTTQNSCTSAGICSNPGETTSYSCTSNKACSKPQYTSRTFCQSNGGIWAYGTWTTGVWAAATWTPDNHNTWTGCVMDRGNSTAPDAVNNYDTNAGQPSTGIPSSLYPAEQYSACPSAAVMPLNYNWTSMTSLVNSMSPNGNTNQAIGLQLGWMSLVGGGPFPTPPAMDSNYQYSQIIILLTDGLNTQDRWYTSQSSIDAREQLTCNNIKAANITLYTIQVNTGGDPTSTLLQNCASSSDKFFLLTSASQIVATFNAIGTNLTKLRVAQ